MPLPPVPPERTKPAHAANKRKAAARYESEAARLRAEAAELDRQWQEYNKAKVKKAAKS